MTNQKQVTEVNEDEAAMAADYAYWEALEEHSKNLLVGCDCEECEGKD